MAGDRARLGATPSSNSAAAAAASASPRRPRHSFTRSLSEISSPLRLRRHSQSQDPDHQGQAPSGQATPALMEHDQDDGPGTPLAKARTTGTLTSGTSGTSGTSTPTEYSAPPSMRDPASATASPSSSRRPSVRTSRDFVEEQQLLQPPHLQSQSAPQPQPQRQTPLPAPPLPTPHHHHHRPHIHHRHHHHHTSSSAVNGLYLGSHSTTMAAFAAATTAVAAASPTGTSMPNPLSSAAGDSAADRAHHHDDADAPGDASSHKVPLSAIDAETVAAVAATLRKMQRRQSRQAARVLQTAVADIDGLSTRTSERLDAAYGSILGRIATLQDTILALRSLAAAARATNERFTSGADALAHDMDQQIAQLEGFSTENKEKESKITPDEQQARLQQLSARVKAGRQAIESLSARVDRVRGRVDAWERADKGWQERTRTRIRVLWVISAGVIVAAIAVYVAVRWLTGAPHATPVEAAAAAAESTADASRPGPPDLSALSKLTSPAAPTTGKFYLSFPNSTATEPAPDGKLQHLFDEL